MNSIESKRKELENKMIKATLEDKNVYEIAMQYKLEGFNLGVELAQKEFLDAYDKIDKEPKNNNRHDEQYWKWQFISKYIEELKNPEKKAKGKKKK